MSETNKNFRASFVLDMRDKKESVEEIIDQLKSEVAAIHGEVTNVENLGTKNFARTPDKRLPSGIFVNIDFRSSLTAPGELRERLRLNKTVNRMMVVAIA